MNVCISIAEHELEMSHRWFQWVMELGGTEGHRFFLIPSAGVNISDVLVKASFSLSTVMIKDEESQTSDWQNTEQLRSASGPNSAFRQVAWHFYMNKLGPYFWCELDCVPLRKDWLDRLETEYKSCGKPFMGAHVQIESVPEHMSGNAIYADVPEQAPGLVQRTNWTPKGQDRSFELAFDIAGAKDVLPKAHFTSLIQHKFRFKGFESRAEFDTVIDPNAVVFHSDKSGSIYKYLRENLSGGNAPACKDNKEVGRSGVAPVVSTEVGAVLPVIPSDSASRVPLAQNNLSGNVGVASRCGGDDEAGLGSSPAQTNLPVPVLAEPSCAPKSCEGGEARESIQLEELPKTADNVSAEPYPQTTRGGQTTSSDTEVVTKTFTPSDELEKVIAQNSVIKNGLPAMSPPWENREDSERDVKMLCDALSLFAKSPVYKHRVREALRAAKIIR